jgi:AcrR family transcriptional regulator
MPSRAERAATQRTPLTLDRVLGAAIELADTAGIDALSMRKLAQVLGVEAMTLYYHAANKDDILNGMLDVVTTEIELPGPEAPWREALRATAVSAYEIYLRHPWAAGLSLSPARMRPSRLRYMDAILASLRRGGFSTDMAHHAYHALESHIVGFTLWVVGISTGVASLEDEGAGLVEVIAAGPYPYLLEHVEHHRQIDGTSDDSEFEFGLDLLLDGLERRQAGVGHGSDEDRGSIIPPLRP